LTFRRAKMGIFSKIFEGITKNEAESFESRLHEKIDQLVPHSDDKEKLTIACLSGLMARVAFVDLKLDPGERSCIIDGLKEWTNFRDEEVEAIAELAIDEVKDLAGLENHKYCYPLNDILSNDARYEIVKSLFAVAAADGQVENMESEEIRNITKGLLLEHKHYIAARAMVMDKLLALKD
jgi:uncharacterized tellurite resistance protein B-like protein